MAAWRVQEFIVFALAGIAQGDTGAPPDASSVEDQVEPGAGLCFGGAPPPLSGLPL